MSFRYRYERPGLAVDCVVFGVSLAEESLKVLLVERDIEPFRGVWALPGGFVRKGEPIDAAAERELAEETGLEGVYLEQLYTFGDPDRDPRGWIVTVAYYALVSPGELKASADARNARWFGIDDLPELAFDHARILESALARLRGKIRYAPVGFELMPVKFTLAELQKLYEVILERKLDRANFRRKILGMGLLSELNECEKNVPHRAARLYRFDKRRYDDLARRGFNFEI